MEEDNTKKRKERSKNFEQIFREREHLDQILEQEFQKEITLLFSDICGFTKYIDERGDINGRALLLKHNRIVLPQIEEHKGEVVEVIGDGVMASFSSPLAAVKSAIAIQKALYEHNANTKTADKLHVKIGINIGEALVDETAVYQRLTGDVANVTSRIQAEALPDQILISSAVFNRISKNKEALCRFYGTTRVKGKAQPLELYQVTGQGEDILPGRGLKSQLHQPVTGKKAEQPLRLFDLEIAKEGDRLNLSAHEQIPGEENTIRRYEKIAVSTDMIETTCRQMVDTLNKANSKARIAGEVLTRLREIGQVLYDELFPLSVKEKIGKTKAKYLRLKIDDQLVHIPWELLHDGKEFLCLRFNMGRLVKTRQLFPDLRFRVPSSPLKMLILADPGDDLKGAYTEGVQIRDLLDGHTDLINVSLRSGDINPNSIKEKIRNFDFVHFAGHADYDPQKPGQSGWRLTHGLLKAQDIIKMAGAGQMPSFIFSNACQSARTEEWRLNADFENEIFGLANAFLLAGIKHYIGTFWEILDEPSSRFGLDFYHCLISGMTTGEAVRRSRQALIKRYGEEMIVWASYVMYGDPASSYTDRIETDDPLIEPNRPRIATTATGDVRAREEIIDFAEKKVVNKKGVWWLTAAAIILLIALMLWLHPAILQDGTQGDEKAALAYYTDGNFEKALDLCKILEEKDLNTGLTYLICGNIHLSKGELNAAETAYKKALQVKRQPYIQKADALVGLGRVAAFRKQPNDALMYYQQSVEAAPESTSGYISQALLLEDRGDYDRAVDLLVKARAISPRDTALSAFTNETIKRAMFAKDQKKQERIDRTVKELLERIKSPLPASRSDGWTSPPLTMWIMDFDVQGYSVCQGQERLLVSDISERILQHSRARLVERALLDTLVNELKLGSSKLTDQRSMLFLGRILAARLIISSRMVYSGPDVSVSMRLIETETGRITAVLNESFKTIVPVSLSAERLSDELLKKLKQLYPLRGKVLEVKDGEIRLNIGEMAGVRTGQRFSVSGGDIILEVTSIQQDRSLARRVKGKGLIQKGDQVEQEKAHGLL
ncbi:MAG: CHAT domain-containing protein [Deltaproteobacteria bacterium]|nr:CHAT domain-containing protein [Deltaproteobacteria bacterium]